MQRYTLSSNGSSANILTDKQLFSLFISIWGKKALTFPRYPTVIGGVNGSYTTGLGHSISSANFSSLLKSYRANKTAIIRINGHVSTSPDVSFIYRPNAAGTSVASIQINAANKRQADGILNKFVKYFPFPSSNKLDLYLQQHGYKVASFDAVSRSIDLEQYSTLTKRIAARSVMGLSYGSFFEKLIGQLMETEFQLTSRLRVQFKDEGEGGDFDVLSLTEFGELFYLECKTGTISQSDLIEFYKRHSFLRPSISIMVVDLSKTVLQSKLLSLSDPAKTEKGTPERILGHISQVEAIPDSAHQFAFHANRNLYFCAGDDLVRGLRHCLRHFRGVVQQTSYWN